MPYGEHVAKCMECGKRWIVGDCIPSFCSDKCEKKFNEWLDKVGISFPQPTERVRQRGKELEPLAKELLDRKDSP